MPMWGIAAAVVVILGLGSFALVASSQQVQADYNRKPQPVPTFTPKESETPSAPAIPAPAVTVTLDFANPGELPDEVGGHVVGVHENGGNSDGFFVADGLLQHGEPTRENAASYLEIPIGKPVEVIGSDVVFRGEESGQVAMVVWQSSIVADPIPPAGIHFVAGRDAWHVSYWEDGETNYAEGTFATPLALDTPHRFEVVRSGAQVWVTLPDGSTAGPFTHPAVESMASEWASWELYERRPGLTPAAFAGVWAG